MVIDGVMFLAPSVQNYVDSRMVEIRLRTEDAAISLATGRG
jgi:hypothetical protein